MLLDQKNVDDASVIVCRPRKATVHRSRTLEMACHVEIEIASTTHTFFNFYLRCWFNVSHFKKTSS